MRLSVLACAPHSWTDLLALARHAESTGWDGFWVGDSPGTSIEAWTALSGLASRVPRLRLGSLVSNPADRHPAVLTKLAVTVDRLSGGRAVLGLGAGGARPEAAPERLSRLEEACEVVKALLANERTTFRGRHFRLVDAPLEPKALQRPLPLLVGGDGERVTLRIAARWADEWNGWGDEATMRTKLEILDRHCAAVGRDPRQIRRSGQALVSVDGRSGAASGLLIAPAWAIPPAEPLPVIEPAAIAGYAAAGLDEFIVPDLLLGEGRAKLAALDAIRALSC
jgi:alkanesulfonate monooxygenase SsuD/methylene tetrahydromethanopterin reductase-like flavin-dependent oxidoreductase (luciferase family)